MKNWKEYLDKHKGVDRNAYIIERRIEMMNKRSKLLPIVAIICFIVSLYFLKDFTNTKSFYSLISLGIYPYVVMILFLALLAFSELTKFGDSNRILSFFFYVFFISNLAIFFKYFIFVTPSDLFERAVNGEVYIPEYGSIKVVDLSNIKIGVSLLLVSSLNCVGISLVDRKINKMVQEIEFIIRNHSNNKNIDNVYNWKIPK